MKQVILVVVAMVSLLTLSAQEDKRMLTFEQALGKTMGNNPQISAIKYEQKAAEQQRKAAIGLRMPHIGVSGTYAYMGDDIAIDLNSAKPAVEGILGELGSAGIQLPPAVLEQAGALLATNWGITLQERDFGFIGASVTMPLYMGGKINAANRAARINEESTAQHGRQSSNALVSELAERYYGLSLANQVVKVRQSVVDGVRVHLNDAIALEKSGMIAKGDRLYAQVKMSEAERELLNAQLQAQTIHSALCNTLNEDADFIPISTMFILNEIQGVDYFQQLAAQNSPLLNQVALKKDLAVEGVKLQRADFLPQVAIMGGAQLYNHQVSKYVPNWAVGAGVKLKIFDGLSREYKYSAAKNTVRQVEALQTKAGKDIFVMIEKIYNEMRNYHDRIPSIDASMNFANEYLRIKEAAFREGMASSADVIDAQLNLAKIKTERIQAAYYYDLMLARLLEAAGVSDQFISYAQSSVAKAVKFE